jgi:hypothetical protein
MADTIRQIVRMYCPLAPGVRRTGKELEFANGRLRKSGVRPEAGQAHSAGGYPGDTTRWLF